jgi:beta-N-acetylhexosaminidase
VIALARALRAGLADAGLAATGKHFPGHGGVAADSHLELPVDRRSRMQIEDQDLAPFTALIEDGIESLMMAHVRYTAFDPTPASLSRKWIAGLLRRRLGFRGAVFCDDLSMNGAAVAGSLEERARAALDAGCDMLPVCNDRPGLAALLDALKDVKPRPSASRRLRALYRREVENND